jgi:shikimate O-hydroxycinnamoyltransferase
MGIARHHQVADGEAASHFMQAWASALKGSPVSSVLHDRSTLTPKEASKPSFDHPEYKKPPPKPDTGDTSSNPPLVRKKLHFDVETLKKIKTSTVREGDGCNTYTTFESLTGHLWRCVTQARGLAGDVETRSLVAANGRRRLDPPVPEDFFGNVIFHACPQTKVGQLLDEPLSYAADLVHTAIRRLDNEYMRSAMDFVEEQRTNPAPVARGRTSVLSPNLSVTSWVQLPLYKLDFGWGTPVFAGPPFIPFEGLVILVPSYTQDGSIDVLIGLFEPHMAKFQEICYQVAPRE